MSDEPVIVIVGHPNIADLVEHLQRDGYRPYQASTAACAQVIAERPSSSCSTSASRANSTASVSAAIRAESTSRSSSSPLAAQIDRSSGSGSVPTTMSPNRFRP